MKKRIMLYGGPGSGKSTAAHYLMWRLKNNNITADMAREVIKRRAFAGGQIDPVLDQLQVLGEQVAEERAAIATGAVVVSDSPILLQAAYTSCVPLEDAVCVAAGKIEAETPASHIFIKRSDTRFSQEGRWQTLEAAKLKDAIIRSYLRSCGFPFAEIDYGDWDTLWEYATQ